MRSAIVPRGPGGLTAVYAVSTLVAFPTARHAGLPLKVSALIRAHGIALWVRRLPIIDRPHHTRQEGV